MLEKYRKDQKYRELVVSLVVKCASRAYVDGKEERATELIALLCESKIVMGNDLRVAAGYMIARSAIRRKAIDALLKVPLSSDRAQERKCFWICHLLNSKPADQRGGMADTLAQLGIAFRKFKYLEESEQLEVTTLLKQYKSEKGKLPK